MYCANCGKELVEGANFCTACGSRSVVAERMAAPEEATAEATGGVSTALASGRSRSRLRMSPLVLLVLVLALTAGIAAAAVYVYNEVYLPSVGQEKGEADEQPVTDAGGTAIANASYSFEYETAGDYGNYRFMYPVISGAQDNPAINALNEYMRAGAQEAAESALPDSIVNDTTTMSWMNYDDGTGRDRFYTTRRYYITYFEDGIASIWEVSKYVEAGHMQYTMTGECMTVDLETGERLKPESVLGLDEGALYEYTYSALEGATYGFGVAAGSSIFDAESAVRAIVSNSGERYFIVPGGLALSVDRSEFQTPYGLDSLVVYADQDNPGDFATGDVFYGGDTTSLQKLPQMPDIVPSNLT